MEQAHKRGFTLLELLIVITILAILSLVVILFINPVEILKKSRDVQRMSDLSSLKTAISIWLQDKSTNTLHGGGINCSTTASATAIDDSVTTNDIRISLIATSAAGGYKTGTDGGTRYAYATTSADVYDADGTGWISPNTVGAPSFLTSVTGGSPLDRLPVDPTNTGGAGVAGVDSLYYRFGCKSDNTFEIDATLESDTYKYLGTEDRPSKDGGNAVMRFEVGTNLNILPSTAPISWLLS